MNPIATRSNNIKPIVIRVKPNILEPSAMAGDGAGTRWLSSWPGLDQPFVFQLVLPLELFQMSSLR